MKKILIALSFIVCLTSTTSALTWYNPVTVTAIRVYSGSTACEVYFQTDGFPANRWWYINGATPAGKEQMAIVLTAKSMGMLVTFVGGTWYSNFDGTDTYRIDAIKL